MAKKWTKNEDDFLKRNHMNYSVFEISNITGRTASSITSRCRRLGIKPKSNRYWNEWEDKILLENYKELTIEQLSDLINGRDTESVIRRINKLGLEYNKSIKKWSEKEELFLLKNSTKYTFTELCEIMEGRTESSIRSRLQVLGVSPKSKNGWTNYEKEILKNSNESLTIQKISKILPNRCGGSIRIKMKEMGLKPAPSVVPLSDLEIEKLLALSKTHNIEELSNMFNRSENTIRKKLKEYGKTAKHKLKWTKEEDSFIIKNCKKYTYFELAELMPNRTIKAVQSRACILGVRAIQNNRGWKKEEWLKCAKNSENFDCFKLYKIRCWNNTEYFYKIGITFLDLKLRFTHSLMPYDYEVIEIIKSDDGGYIYDLETVLHREHSDFKYKPMIEFQGDGECFTRIL